MTHVKFVIILNLFTLYGFIVLILVNSNTVESECGGKYLDNEMDGMVFILKSHLSTYESRYSWYRNDGIADSA